MFCKFKTHSHTPIIVIYYTDLGGISNNNSNILIFKVMVIVIYYIDLGGIINSNSNVLIFKVIVIVIYCIVIDLMSGQY